MSQPTYVSSVSYRNQLLLPRDLYPPVETPTGIPVWAPFYLSMAGMITLAQERRNRYGYSTRDTLSQTAGYTRTDLAVRFIDFDRQWLCEPPYWRYQGGRICLDLTIGIYVDERSRSRPRCMSLILSHELQHVADEIDLVRNWLPTQAAARLSGRLSNLHESRFDSAVRGRGNGEGSAFERAVQRLWVEGGSRRAEDLHRRRPADSEEIRECMSGV